MRGSVVKRGKRWTIVFDVGVDPASGRRKQKWESGFERRADAERALRERLGVVERGGYREPTKETLAVFLRTWLEGRQGLEASTRASYEMIIEKRIIPVLGGMRASAVGADDLSRLYRKLAASGSRTKKPLSPRSVAYVHSLLSKAFRDGVRTRRLAYNPVADVEPPKQMRTEFSVWSPALLRVFLDHVRDHRLYAAWRIFATVGPRRGEVAGLEWSGVDLDHGRLSISQTITLADNKVITKPRTKTGRPRTVALDAETVAALRLWSARQKRERLEAGEAWVETGLVFAWEDGSVINPERWSDWFEAHAKAAGLPRIRLHDLRHSAATLMLAAGIATRLVSDRLGHSNTATTTDIYQHAIEELQHHTADEIARVLRGAADSR